MEQGRNGRIEARRNAVQSRGLACALALTIGVIGTPSMAEEGGLELGPRLARGEPIDIAFPEPQSVLDIYRAMERAFDAHIVLVPAVEDAAVRFEGSNVTFVEALDRLTAEAGHFYIVEGPSEVLVAPDTPQNRRRYERLWMATFHLDLAPLEEAVNVLRSILDLRKVAWDQRLRTITVRSTAVQVELAHRLLERMDQSAGRVELRAEVFAVTQPFTLADSGSVLARQEAVRLLTGAGGDRALDQTQRLASGASSRVRLSSRLHGGQSADSVALGEGLTLDTTVRRLQDGTVLVEARTQGACLRDAQPGTALRLETREQSTGGRLAPGQALVVSNVIPSTGGSSSRTDGTCALLVESPSTPRHFELLLSATSTPPTRHRVKVDAIPVGTEYQAELENQ